MSATKGVGLILLLLFVIIGAYESAKIIVNTIYYQIYLPIKSAYDSFIHFLHNVQHPFGLAILSIQGQIIPTTIPEFTMLGFQDNVSSIIGVLSYTLIVAIIYLVIINAVRSLKSRKIQFYFIVFASFVLGSFLIYLSQVIAGISVILLGVLLLLVNMRFSKKESGNAKE